MAPISLVDEAQPVAAAMDNANINFFNFNTPCVEFDVLYIWSIAETTYLNAPIAYPTGSGLQDC